jgi:hypothetical protein
MSGSRVRRSGRWIETARIQEACFEAWSSETSRLLVKITFEPANELAFVHAYVIFTKRNEMTEADTCLYKMILAISKVLFCTSEK